MSCARKRGLRLSSFPRTVEEQDGWSAVTFCEAFTGAFIQLVG